MNRIVLAAVMALIVFATPTVVSTATSEIELDSPADAHTQIYKCRTDSSWYEWDGSTWWKVRYQDWWISNGHLYRKYSHSYHSGVRKSGHWVYYKCSLG